MFIRLSHITLFFLSLVFSTVEAQELKIISETSSYIEYEIENNEAGIYPAYEFIVPIINGEPQFRIIGQSVFEKNTKLTKERAIRLEISNSSTPLAEVVQPGKYRGQDVASLKVHLARYSQTSTLITKNIHFVVNKVIEDPATFSNSGRKALVSNHPLSAGNWYKIPISKKGIYALNTSYLSSLGINVTSIDPRKIQLWGTDGYALPELNILERPEFSEIPIIVEGQSDGDFDSNDRVIFYGNSPHRETRSGSSFTQSIHPYSDSTYVFLTIGSTNGLRMNTINSGLTPSRTIDSFTDFIWKEEELTKTETKQKSGRYWLGQTIPTTAQNQFVTIFKDTIPDLDTSKPILVSGKIYLRSEVSTAFEMQINETPFREFTISRLSTDYGSYEGTSAQSSTFSNVPLNIQSNNGVIEAELMMKNTDSGANAFVDYLGFSVNRKLSPNNKVLFFFPPAIGDISEAVEYLLTGFNQQPLAMDVSDPVNPKLLSVSETGNIYSIVYHSDPSLKIITQSSLNTPALGKLIPNQNLHSISSFPDYIVITSEILTPYAQELADYRQTKDGFETLVVTQNQIFNEFSNGAIDPTAIRDFLRNLWSTALLEGQSPPKYLLLFGDTTFDTKGIIKNAYTNHVVTYQTSESINRISSYGSDDYFGLMDDSEGLLTNSAKIDLGIGRISAQTRSEAATAIDKIKRYENPANFGDWQNLFTFAGDDDLPNQNVNRDLHIENADGTLRRMNLVASGSRYKKIYLFDYQEEITGAGRKLPEATSDFLGALNNGTLVLNYSGHGNSQALTDEELYRSDFITQLTNRNKLALFVTATCQFGRYDDINVQSGAEKLVFADNGGAIASFTTTRVVYTSSSPTSYNYGLNIALSQAMLERDEDGNPLRLGDIYSKTKNTSVGSGQNARKFILLGDPAIRIALPNRPAEIETINGKSIAEQDTFLIKALDRVTLSGGVKSPEGALLSNFNGEVTITIFDAPRTVRVPQDKPWIENSGCHLNSNTDKECTYEVENDVLFKGKTTVKNGVFSLTLIVPKDISFSPDKGRIIMYAKNELITAGGSFSNVLFNGVNTSAVNDGKGPSLDVYLNDQTFINGSLANGSPNLIIELADSSGINTTGTGVGHEIIATIDTNPQQTFVLNDFYEGNLNDYTSGRIEYPLDQIPEGNYALKVRAWDVHNNPSEKEVFFEVAEQEDLVVKNTYNYPNPMNNSTSFTFEHNQQGNQLDVDIRIYTLSGKPVHRIKEYITPSNTLSSYASIPWNGRDRDNDRLGNGTYIYVLRVATDTPEGRKSTEKIEKLVIIR